MTKLKQNSETLNWDNVDTLFLDRDGVINVRLIDDYVKVWDEFEFLPGVLDALKVFNARFKHIFIVTNQQGVGKKLMTEEDLQQIHAKMLTEICNHGGRIDKVYHCAALRSENSPFRKPQPGMAYRAKEEYPQIDLLRAVMVGDSASDIAFGQNAGMKTVFVLPQSFEKQKLYPEPNLVVEDLVSFAKFLVKLK